MKIKKLVYLVLIASSCTQSKKSIDIVEDNFSFASQQLNFAFTEIENVKAGFDERQKEQMLVSPRNIEPDGTLRLVASRDWTSGFFPGMLWYMYEYTQDDYWKQKAQLFTQPLEREKTNGVTHDMGFKIYGSFGKGYRLTNNQLYKKIMLEGAYTLITRYKPNVGCIRSWDHNQDKWQCPVIIDNMMNLELLFWAFKESGDSTFYQIACSHAMTTLRNHFRPDYSSYHVVDYDTITGQVLNKHTHQGYSHESAWSRGQAWGLYGYTMSFRETGIPEFLEQAKKIADFMFVNKNLPDDLIPYWDYNAPAIPDEPRDVSAATISASALYELSLYDKDNATKYKQWADTILENLTKNYRATLQADRGFLLLHSTGSAPHNSEVDVPIIYSDYFFLEALMRKRNCSLADNQKKTIEETLGSEILKQAAEQLNETPVTVTSHIAARSAGGAHDFFSEGDYWWPNPNNPDGPYIQRDGETNPDNFVAHRHAMVRFSMIVGNLTSAYLLTKDMKYAEAALRHIRAWFINEDTRMNPNLLYAQAIKGIVTGRGIGIIDTVHLIEVVQALIRLKEAGILPENDWNETKKWFADYLEWMSTHPYGISEMNATNNHATCWAMQAAIFAKYTDNNQILTLCADRFKKVFLAEHAAQDGSFPREIGRTKPYGYSIFNLDAMATLCHILSSPGQNLWEYTTSDGKNMQKSIEFLYPYIIEKDNWPYNHDVMYWDEWPVAQPFLLFAALNLHNNKYLDTWQQLEHFPVVDEVLRNVPIRNPLLWLSN